MHIPFVDLKAQYYSLKAELDQAIASVVASSSFVGGRFVADFEQAFADASGVRQCLGCANGTDAIYIVLRMLGVGAGDEVITSAMSWIATSETITQAGATPVFVDVDENFGIDPLLIERKITSRTKAIIPVHLYGQPAAMPAISEIAKRHDLTVIEDCAQAHLATIGGRPVGTIGVAGTFSFYPAKNLGAWGDAGAIVSDDAELISECRRFANHGSLQKHQHDIEGINSRLDGLQASILSVKLRYLRRWTERRRTIAQQYDEELSGIRQLVIPGRRTGATHVFHLYVVRAEDRDALRAHLANEGIETQIHYPRALPFLPAYERFRASPDDFRQAARMQREILSLPMFAELSAERVSHVCNAIRTFYGS